MKLLEIFLTEGTIVPIEGNKPQILDDDGYVWLVEQGRVSLFLANITKDNVTGRKNFLFAAKQGDLLFGVTPQGFPDKLGFWAAGLVGSRLIRLELNRLNQLLDGETSQEMEPLVKHWLNLLAKISSSEDLEIMEIAATEESLGQENNFLKNFSMRQSFHSSVLQAAGRLWEKQDMAERNRLQEKATNDRRQVANAISKLALISQKEKTVSLEEVSGDELLDACRLVGQAMNVKIISPPAAETFAERQMNLDDIARASRLRTREVLLQGEWYKHDSGPILSYLKEDNRPVALIPASPHKYILHDLTSHTKKVIDKETAATLKSFGFIFYRPFENKQITIKDLITFGYKSSWKRDLAVILLMGILGGILGTAIPLATGIVFSSIIPEGERRQLLQVAFFLGASALATMLFALTRSLATLRMEGKMDGSVQAAVWDRLLSLPVTFYKEFSAGELTMRAMGINQIRIILSGVTLNTIMSGLFSVFTFALLFYYDTRLAWVAAMLVFIAIVVIGLLGYWQIRYERRVLEISNKISGMMLQIIGGITKFRVAGAENRVFAQWAKDFGEQRELTFKRETLGNWLTTFNALFPTITSMVIFYRLTSSNSTLAPGQFIAFNAASVSFMASMVALSDSLIKANIIIPLYQRAKPILETLPEYDETKAAPNRLTGSIEVSHLTFRYQEDGPAILNDISFKIDEGDYVGLVGTSGCGKSTLFRVLLGFETPETGKVYYDGQDLSKVDIRLIRKQLGVALQNAQLMTGDIFTNIVGANPYLTINDAWAAAAMAGIDQDIREMPMGMHTVIGEGAGTISGGQKQRLMIARAIINKPRILFFDEATSALDNQNQALVSKSLDQLQATRIVIAHRLSTIINCNKIFVMDKGRIVESGSYQELMAQNGIFADLAKRQLA